MNLYQSLSTYISLYSSLLCHLIIWKYISNKKENEQAFLGHFQPP